MTDVSNRSRVQRGVPTGGEFTTEARADNGDLVVDEVPLSEREPDDIDGELATLLAAQYRLEDQRTRQLDYLHSYIGDKKHYRYTKFGSWVMDDEQAEALAREKAKTGEGIAYYQLEGLKRSVAQLDQVNIALKDNQAQANVLEDEFVRRGGWPRSFIAQSSDGHAHSSMHCPTCNKGRSRTRFAWMTDYSGKTEEEIVAAAGWRACTVCYPSAPVGDERSLPTQMWTPEDIDKDKARQEREAAKLARDAAKIAKALTSDGSEFTVPTAVLSSNGRQRTESFKTEQAATQWAVGHIVDRKWYYTNPYAELAEDLKVRDQSVESVIAAVAAKHGRTVQEVRAEFEAKAAAKAKRDGWGR